MRNYFTFGTVNSKNYGLYISGSGRFVIPERSYEFSPVPGRLGDAVVGGRSLENIVVRYPCFFAPANGAFGNYQTLESAFGAFKNALFSQNGYVQLKDSYDTTHYRMAAYVGGTSQIKPTQLFDAAEFTLEFNCKPQRYLNSTTTHTITNGSTTTIQTNGLRAYPIFTLTGTGSFDFILDGEVEETVAVTTPFTNGMVIDCERKVCYDPDNPSASGNLFVNFSGYKYPEVNNFGRPLAAEVSIASTGLSGTVEMRWLEL